MIRNTERIRLALASLVVASGVFAGVVSGCGGDDTSPAETADGGGTDTGMMDVTVDSPVADTGPLPDAGPDSAADSGKDVATDAPTLTDFGHQIDVAFCTRLTACCLQTPSTFNVAQCIADYDSYGGIIAIEKYEAFYDGGTVNYDPAKAAQCLTGVANLPCGLMTATQLNTLKAGCFSAVTGTITANGACHSSIECATGFCALVDGGGQCTPLLTQGASCTTRNGDECDSLGNGTPSLNCDLDPTDASPTGLACTPRLGLDAGCVNYHECTTSLCIGTCTDKFVVSDPGTPNGYCSSYTIADAGGGG